MDWNYTPSDSEKVVQVLDINIDNRGTRIVSFSTIHCADYVPVVYNCVSTS
jgi:hypothetical protein